MNKVISWFLSIFKKKEVVEEYTISIKTPIENKITEEEKVALAEETKATVAFNSKWFPNKMEGFIDKCRENNLDFYIKLNGEWFETIHIRAGKTYCVADRINASIDRAINTCDGNNKVKIFDLALDPKFLILDIRIG